MMAAIFDLWPSEVKFQSNLDLCLIESDLQSDWFFLSVLSISNSLRLRSHASDKLLSTHLAFEVHNFGHCVFLLKGVLVVLS